METIDARFVPLGKKRPLWAHTVGPAARPATSAIPTLSSPHRRMEALFRPGNTPYHDTPLAINKAKAAPPVVLVLVSTPIARCLVQALPKPVRALMTGTLHLTLAML